MVHIKCVLNKIILDRSTKILDYYPAKTKQNKYIARHNQSTQENKTNS